MNMDEARAELRDLQKECDSVQGNYKDCEKGHTDQLEEAEQALQRMVGRTQALAEFFASR